MLFPSAGRWVLPDMAILILTPMTINEAGRRHTGPSPSLRSDACRYLCFTEFLGLLGKQAQTMLHLVGCGSKAYPVPAPAMTTFTWYAPKFSGFVKVLMQVTKIHWNANCAIEIEFECRHQTLNGLINHHDWVTVV